MKRRRSESSPRPATDSSSVYHQPPIRKQSLALKPRSEWLLSRRRPAPKDILERHSVGKIGVLSESWDYRTAIERTAKELGFGRTHLRSLRHSAITDAANKGATRVELQALAGHAFATTTDRYLHSDLDDAQRALVARKRHTAPKRSASQVCKIA